MGSPDFAVPVLKALHEEFQVVAVITQMDKPKGRGRKAAPTPIKLLGENLGLPLWEPQKLSDSEVHTRLRDLTPDVIVVVAFGKILPREILSIPAFGCVNLHASLLPKFRGASPIASAILVGEQVTGVTTMLMDEGMDTGDILLQQQTPIDPTDTVETLARTLSEAGAPLIIRTLKALFQGKLEPNPQNNDDATYTQLLTKEDARIVWQQDAESIERLVRAMNPWPVAFYQKDAEQMKIWSVSVARGEEVPGRIHSLLADAILVGTGRGLLRIDEIQAPGKKRINAGEFARGRRLRVGNSLY